MMDIKRKIYLKYRWIFHRIKERQGKVYGIEDYKQIPIIINSFNQLSYLKSLISRLSEMGYNNIHILDNASTYPPLLEFYEQTEYPVYKLGENLGYKALWMSNIFDKFKHNYYVYTDPDVIPVEECPDDFLKYFMEIMMRFPKAQKVGFSLRINDIPDFNINKNKIIKWEKKWWERKIGEGLYDAQIDTTFALYRPFAFGEANFVELNIRTDFPYQAAHLPWYLDPDNLPEEQRFYLDNLSKSTHWSKQVNNK